MNSGGITQVPEMEFVGEYKKSLPSGYTRNNLLYENIPIENGKRYMAILRPTKYQSANAASACGVALYPSVELPISVTSRDSGYNYSNINGKITFSCYNKWIDININPDNFLELHEYILELYKINV